MGAIRIVGVAARSVSVGGVVRDASAAVVTRKARRIVRSCIGGGTALGFKLLPRDVVLADFNTGSGP
jgi:hypothetical protein